MQQVKQQRPPGADMWAPHARGSSAMDPSRPHPPAAPGPGPLPVYPNPHVHSATNAVTKQYNQALMYQYGWPPMAGMPNGAQLPTSAPPHVRPYPYPHSSPVPLPGSHFSGWFGQGPAHNAMHPTALEEVASPTTAPPKSGLKS